MVVHILHKIKKKAICTSWFDPTIFCLHQMTTGSQTPAVKPPMTTLWWGTLKLSGRILRRECGSPTGRSSPPCPAPPWPPTVAGGACWGRGRWCWLRHWFCTSWAEVGEMMGPGLSHSKNHITVMSDLMPKTKKVQKVELDSSQFKVTAVAAKSWRSGPQHSSMWRVIKWNVNFSFLVTFFMH